MITAPHGLGSGGGGGRAVAATATATAAAPPQRARPAPRPRGPDTPPPQRALLLVNIFAEPTLIGWHGCRGTPERAAEVGLPVGVVRGGQGAQWIRGVAIGGRGGGELELGPQWTPTGRRGQRVALSVERTSCVPHNACRAAAYARSKQGGHREPRLGGQDPRFESRSRHFRSACG